MIFQTIELTLRILKIIVYVRKGISIKRELQLAKIAIIRVKNAQELHFRIVFNVILQILDFLKKANVNVFLNSSII